MKFILLFTQITGTGDAIAMPTDTAAAGGKETMTFIDLFLGGGLYIMIPLLILFCLALYIFFERLIAINRASGLEAPLMASVSGYIKDGDVKGAIHTCSSTDSPVARMIEKGIKRIGKPMDDIRASVENVGKLEIYKLEKNLSTLATVAGAAPMIGFLGTVIGMIVTFREMAYSGNGVQIGQLAGGIMQAMITTVGGLVIGIIAYIAYNMLVAKMEKVIHRMEASSFEFLDLLQEPGK